MLSKKEQHQNKTDKKKDATPPLLETTYSNRQHNYLLNYAIPIDPMYYMYSYYQYVILKPWTEQGVEFSQMSQYWSFNQKNVASINQLFRVGITKSNILWTELLLTYIHNRLHSMLCLSLVLPEVNHIRAMPL